VSAPCSSASPWKAARWPLAAVAAACLLACTATARAQQPAGGVPKPANAILVASFNIQVFGESKLSKPQVVEVLARVVRNFDIVAIQEVRAKSDEILPAFVRAVNADGSRYQHVIGPREGRTSSNTPSSTTPLASRSIRRPWACSPIRRGGCTGRRCTPASAPASFPPSWPSPSGW
jgi:hypothetical protein